MGSINSHIGQPAGKPIHKPLPLACPYGQRAPGSGKCGVAVKCPNPAGRGHAPPLAELGS